MKKLLISLAVLVLAVSAFQCKKGVPKEAFTGALPNKVTTATAAGIRVMSNTPIDASLLPKIDEGFASITNKSKAAYGRALQPGQVTIGLWPRSSRCTNPGFLVPGVMAWDQDPTYDKDTNPGKVLLCVAGIAPAYGNSQGGIWTPQSAYGALVVADASIIANAVDFELEHETLFAFDINKWWATAGVHAHPLIGDSLAGDTRFKVVHIKATDEILKYFPKLRRTIVRQNALGESEEIAAEPTFCVLLTN